MKARDFIRYLGIFLTLCGISAEAQTLTPPPDSPRTVAGPDGKLDTVVTVVGDNQYFIINTDNFTPADNRTGIGAGINFAKDSVIRVDVTGRASVDGPEQLNDRLARERADKVADIISRDYNVPEDRIFTESIGEDWPLLASLVERDPDVPYKTQLLDIINDPILKPATKEGMMKRLGGRAAWRYLVANILPRMRSAEVVWQIARPLPERPPVYIGPDTMRTDSVAVVVTEVVDSVTVVEMADDWYRKMYVKTNIPAWGMLWQNVALEADLARHWSFALPVYWSPYNYGRQTLKFRTLAFIPEFRYWPNGDNTGFFINAHFGLAYYNYAKGGDYRYQDHDGKTPAIGGGLGLGYRFYFCDNHRWSMEVALGAGIYRLDYDVFQNTPQTKYGYLLERRKRTFYGIDQAAFTISYSFGLRKKEGGDQ